MLRLVGGLAAQNEYVPHGVAIKNQEGYLTCGGTPKGVRGSQPHTCISSPKHHNIWLYKTGLHPSETELLESQVFVLRDPCMYLLTQNSFALGSSAGAALEMPKTYGEKINRLDSEQGLEG